MKSEELIRVHRNEEDVGYFTPETALACLRSGILRSDDWAYCGGLPDWTPLGELLEFRDFSGGAEPLTAPPQLPSPPVLAAVPPVIPPRPQPTKRMTPVVAFMLGGAATFLLGLLLLAILSDSLQPTSSSTSAPTAMPRFEGDRYGRPTPEDLRNGAEWLLEQDRLRGSSPSHDHTP